ncbi:hypothetical protein Afil01_64570 [Actinorhabdospora filicis]|uniref:Htaa domain-containing protein n=1 Tax=Actinorhabdospora filicis TaxID=1785913 RepID=A0A9W6WE90_9ACTN|nr:HtaA domain-containing protein [Actinorhabdospora filicis]GLZ81650.1 hypothetical protein Afil01_64570 [Actinorhabdospora filicis]
MTPRSLRAALAALLLSAALVTVPGTAHAATSTVSGGRLDWGVKSSFQNYVTGPIAKGSYSTTGGAATTGGSRFRFHSATGTYDPGGGALKAGYSGGVRFLGHAKKGGGHELDLTIANPRVEISGGSGVLYADITTPSGTSRGVAFADLGVGGLDLSGGTTGMRLDDIPVTLTGDGARSFAGYYEAGTQLDPLSLSADFKAKPAASPSTSADGKSFTGAAVDWGVRRTFREYVTGDIARGSWTLSGGAQDGGALFRFGDGRGTRTPGGLTASFAGEIRFTGTGLDLRLGGFSVTLAGKKGTLSAKVNGSTSDTPLATFEAALEEDGGLVRLDEVPTVLTAEGATALGGLYAEGTAMDPLWLAVPVESGAALPPLPDLGSDVTPSSAPPSLAATPAAATPSSPLPWIAGAAALLAAAVATVLFLRRKNPVPTQEESPTA